MVTQLQIFLYCTRSKMVAQRRPSLIGRRILFPELSKALLVLMETTAVNSVDPVRKKAVISPPRDLFPMVV